MMGILKKIMLAVALVSVSYPVLAQDLQQSPVVPQGAQHHLTYPKIVLYSTSWCPHCKAAKEYFTRNNIPFINRDVELDDAAMEDLTKKYRSQGVPVLVIGNDEKILKGFNQGNFEKAVKEVQQKK